MHTRGIATAKDLAAQMTPEHDERYGSLIEANNNLVSPRAAKAPERTMRRTSLTLGPGSGASPTSAWRAMSGIEASTRLPRRRCFLPHHVQRIR
jgi:hypothetical protein